MSEEEEGKIGEKLAPYNPTDPKAVEIAIRLLDLKSGDVVYDLGCGDARFLIEACKLQPDIVAKGVEYDVTFFNRAVAAVQANDLSDRISILHENVLNIAFDDASAIFLYLVPTGIKQIREKLIALLQRGIRIVTYVFSIPGIRPIHTEVFKSVIKIYLYTKDSIVE